MSKLRLRMIDNRLGLVINNRLPKTGDVINVEHELALELLKAESAVLLGRIKITRANVMVGGRCCMAGDLVDVVDDLAKRLFTSKVATPAPVKITAKSVVVNGRTYGPGKVIETTTIQSHALITGGLAEYAGEAIWSSNQ